MAEHYKLHINGLDEKMDSGIPDKHIILLTGTPGTMKSSLAYYMLYQNAKKDGVKGLFLTLEQERDNFQYHLNKLGLGEQIEDKLKLFDMTITREQWMKISQKQEAAGEPVEGRVSDEKDLGLFKRQIETLRKLLNFDLLVIDSLPVLELMFRMDDPREDLFHFFKWLKKLNVTTILISEMSQDSPAYSKHDIDFLADGIIKLSMVPQSPTTIQRHIQIAKMRGVDHTTDPFVLRYTGSEFEALKVLM